jgi:hypothetical protein
MLGLEIDRIVSRTGIVSLGNCQMLAAEILAGRRVSIRIHDTTLMIFDSDTGSCCAAAPTR